MVVADLVIFLACTAISLVLTRFVRNLATRNGWVAGPTETRHLHLRPLPRLGGVAIFTTFTLAVAGTAALSRFVDIGVHVPPQLITILLAGTVVFLLGLYDDLRPINAYVKFAIESGAAALMFIGGFRVASVGFLHHHHPLGTGLSLVLTIVWVVWITNAFNLLDGLDGLAAGSALFSTMVMFVLSLITGNALIGFVTLTLAGAILGFLRFNFNPATIFLGDCGSLFIGFVLSAVAISGSHMSSTVVAIAIPVVSFGLPLMDTVVAVFRRSMSGKPLFGADGEHIHHKLLKRGLTHRQAVIVLYAVSGCFGLLSLSLLYPNGHVVGLVLVVLGLGVFLGLQQLGYHEFVELRRIAQRTMEQKQVIINNLAIRRAAEELRRCGSFAAIAQVLSAAFAHNAFDAATVVVEGKQCALSQDMRPFTHDAEGRCYYRWTRPAAVIHIERAPAWTLRLELFNEAGTRSGFLRVARTQCDQPLMLDLNLLTTGFDRALAGALDRAARDAQRVAVTTSRVVPFAAELAGRPLEQSGTS